MINMDRHLPKKDSIQTLHGVPVDSAGSKGLADLVVDKLAQLEIYSNHCSVQHSVVEVDHSVRKDQDL